MAVDRLQIEMALVQVLENYQRCGVTRFGSRPTSELPVEWLERLAELQRAPLPLDMGGGTAQLPVERIPSARFSSAPRPLVGGQVGSAQAAPLRLPAGGLTTELWSFPGLELGQRQQRFDRLAPQICDCRKCSAIVGFRQQTVFGDGPLQPLVCFMGEAPGADEDRTGKPFVGKAGQLLTKIIAAMKLKREDVYILNALKCRPPQNRTPVNDEIDNCRPFVEEQLDVLQPRFIVCLGAVAVRSILRSESPIGRLRGQFHQYRGARVVVTYHPSYLLRNESAKKLVWEDMKMLMAELQSIQAS